jgi:Thrombospondin type 3 repeat
LNHRPPRPGLARPDHETRIGAAAAADERDLSTAVEELTMAVFTGTPIDNVSRATPRAFAAQMGEHRRPLSLLGAAGIALLLKSTVVHADVLVFSSKDQFTEATGALIVPIPNSEEIFPGTSCGVGFEPTGSDFAANAQINIDFDSNVLSLRQDLTNPGNSSIGLCIFDETFSNTSINPSVMIANTIVGNGEDDYFLAFETPVHAFGFRILTNNVAEEIITLWDEEENVIEIIDIDHLTPLNTRQFVGFKSPTPIGALLIDTLNGWSQNEAIDEIIIAQTAPDIDNDGMEDALDNCPIIANSDQADTDGEGIGDACDLCPIDPDNDADQDGICGDVDNCPAVDNANQSDVDSDGVGDACDPDSDNDGIDDVDDNCTFEANPDQADADRDGAGDVCDADDDNDGVIDANDACMPTSAGQQVDAAGCSIAQLCPCVIESGEWKNHGAYVSCVAHAAEDFVDLGLIGEAEKGAIGSQAAESQCGKK